VLNSRALGQAKALGAADVTLSFETGLKQAVKLAGEAKRGVIAYGHLPLMTFRNCPAKGEKGCGSCDGISALTDRMGKQFTVACRNRFYSQLINGVPLWLADKQEALSGLDFATLYFTTESREECAEVVRQYQDKTPSTAPFTRGLYFRSLQ
jgi:putative protease